MCKRAFLALFVVISSFITIKDLSAQEAIYTAGVAAIDMDPPIGIPLAGYGSKRRRAPHLDWRNRHPHAFFFTPTTGFRDRLRSKAMVIHDSKGGRLVFVSVDLIGVSNRLYKDLARKLKKFGYKKDQIFVSATHTHSGPGTLSMNIGLAAIATDLYKKENYKHVFGKIYQSVLTAINKIERVDLFTSQFDAKKVQYNKWRKTRREWYNPTATFILARSKESGEWLGGMLNFAMHGNAMPLEDTRYSGDVPGAIERATERKIALLNDSLAAPPTLLFMNGAEGDVRHRGSRGEEVMEQVAERFAGQAAESALIFENMKEVEVGIKVKSGRTFVGIPSYPLEACVERVGMMRALLAIIPDRIPIPLPLFPWSTKLNVAKLGGITLASWPGEVSTALGYELEAKAKALNKGHDDVWFLGLTNDYLTYFTNKSEYKEGEYDSCSSFYGYRGARRIIKKLTKLMKKID
ncbi:MAG: hypothetical protein HN509_10700 [Halobacteriovoraceae bacterium]|nr:hypothetical protein [Halobacteriovoraceae bacterium]